MSALEVVSAVLMLSGVALALLAAVGLLRFPDVFSRMHAATKPATLGLLLVVVAGIAVGSVVTGGGDFLAVLVAVSLLGFVGTVTVARFVERRGA